MPNFNLSKLIAQGHFKKHLPTADEWFSENAIETGEVSKLVKSLVVPIAAFIVACKNLRLGSYLSSAIGDYLDSWGLDLGITRLSSETDDDYRLRLQEEITRPRNSATAIVNYINSLTGLTASVEQPWRFINFWDSRTPELADGADDPFYGYSGQARYSSSYYAGGVITINVAGYDHRIREKYERIVAAGIKPYFNFNVEDDINFVAPPSTTNRDNVNISTERFVRLNYGDIYSENYYYSGSETFSNSVVNIERQIPIVNALPIMFNEANSYLHLSAFGSATTWHSLENITWEQALIGHIGTSSAEIVIA